MRDRRFVAAHRGGCLALTDHRLLAGWAADCAENVLRLFEAHTTDARPRHAISVARLWAEGKVPVGVAQKAAWASHAAARAASCPAAVAAARAAGHAVATAHMADHSLGSVIYGIKALEAAGEPVALDKMWRMERLPQHLQEMVISSLVSRLPRRYKTAETQVQLPPGV